MITDKQKNFLLYIQTKILDKIWETKTNDQDYILRARAIKLACQDIIGKDDYSIVSRIFDGWQDKENGNTKINEFGSKEILDENQLLQKVENLILETK